VFIKASPWESLYNMESNPEYPKIEDLDHVKWTGGVSWFWFIMYKKHKDKKYNFVHDHKKYDFLYLNKAVRGHRQKLFEKTKSLMHNSLYTNWGEGKKLPPEYEYTPVTEEKTESLVTDIYEKPYNDTKFNLVAETNDTNNEVFITEKLWKPILAKQVFVVHGNLLYLQKLRELGFKTFGNYFDESYDLEIDQKVRIEKITKICGELLKINWQDLYLKTKSLRQYNHDLLLNRDELSKQVNKTLDLFLEFADSSQVSS
jgi:uncharacterized ubiquitin-like protein YukD